MSSAPVQLNVTYPCVEWKHKIGWFTQQLPFIQSGLWAYCGLDVVVRLRLGKWISDKLSSWFYFGFEVDLPKVPHSCFRLFRILPYFPTDPVIVIHGNTGTSPDGARKRPHCVPGPLQIVPFWSERVLVYHFPLNFCRSNCCVSHVLTTFVLNFLGYLNVLLFHNLSKNKGMHKNCPMATSYGIRIGTHEYPQQSAKLLITSFSFQLNLVAYRAHTRFLKNWP